jgi:hypothetical protein
MPPKQQHAYATPGGVRQCESAGKWRFNCKTTLSAKQKREMAAQFPAKQEINTGWQSFGDFFPASMEGRRDQVALFLLDWD